MSTVETTGQPFKIEQKGLREHLLCTKCEGQFSRYETVAADLFRSGKLNVPQQVFGHVVKDLDYASLRLFFLSVLWRSSVSSLRFFEGVNLGPHEERIRWMLLNEQIKPTWKYGCALQDVSSGFPEERLVMVQPIETKADSHRHYFYVLGGFSWHYAVSSHLPDRAITNLYLKQDGTMAIVAGDPSKLPHLSKLKEKLHELGKLSDLINRYGQNT